MLHARRPALQRDHRAAAVEQLSRDGFSDARTRSRYYGSAFHDPPRLERPDYICGTVISTAGTEPGETTMNRFAIGRERVKRVMAIKESGKRAE
jgi:hypothetical protein